MSKFEPVMSASLWLKELKPIMKNSQQVEMYLKRCSGKTIYDTYEILIDKKSKDVWKVERYKRGVKVKLSFQDVLEKIKSALEDESFYSLKTTYSESGDDDEYEFNIYWKNLSNYLPAKELLEQALENLNARDCNRWMQEADDLIKKYKKSTCSAKRNLAQQLEEKQQDALDICLRPDFVEQYIYPSIEEEFQSEKKRRKIQ